MTQLTSHNFQHLTPPRSNLPIIQKLISTYKLWHEYIRYFPKDSRYTLGGKIDKLFIETTEYTVVASYLNKTEKLPIIRKATTKLDLLKFFLQVSWEIKALDTKKYIKLSENLNEIGRMLGGWLKQTQKQNSPSK
jgi:hypothetical protein